MKKCGTTFLFIIFSIICLANDSLTANQRAAIENRPEGLPEAAARALVIHPYRIDTAVSYGVLEPNGFYFPFSGRIIQKKLLKPIFYDGTRWRETGAVSMVIMNRASMEQANYLLNACILGFFMLCLLLTGINLFTFTAEIRSDIKQEAFGEAMCTITRYRRESRFISSRELWFSILISGIIIFIYAVLGSILSWKITMAIVFWICIAGISAYAVRSLVVLIAARRAEQYYARNLALL